MKNKDSVKPIGDVLKKMSNDVADKKNEQLSSVKTLKRSEEYLLPPTITYVIQPNHFTKARYSLNLTQERVLMSIILHYQKYINAVINDRISPVQLELFKDENNKDFFTLDWQISKHYPINHSDEFIKNLEGMIQTLISFTYLDDNKNQRKYTASILTAIDTPDNIKNNTLKKGYVRLTINRKIIEALTSIELDDLNGRRRRYTRYVLESAQGFKSIYTVRMYKYIAMLKGQETAIKISYETLKERLGVFPDKKGKKPYERFSDFKKRVLDVAHKELYKNADCWFNYDVIRENREVAYINIKVVTPEFETANERKLNQIRYFLKEYYNFQDKHFQDIEKLLGNPTYYDRILRKIAYFHQLSIDKPKDYNAIVHKNSYLVTALLKECKENTNIEEDKQETLF